MNWVRVLAANKATSREEMRGLQTLADWYMQYGQQAGIQNQWKEIIAQSDKQAAQKQIAALLKTMESNRAENGFFGAQDEILVDSLNGFKLDDPELYNLYFDNLKTIDQRTPKDQGKPVDGWVIFQAVRKTVEDYLGKPDDNASTQRSALTSAEITDDAIMVPSIKNQRGKGSGLCTEMAAIAHNLWLLAGKTSYFINTQTCELACEQQYENDGHTFCIVEYGDKYRMCDCAMNNFGPMQGNPIEDIKNGRALKYGKAPQNTYIAADEMIAEQNLSTGK